MSLVYYSKQFLGGRGSALNYVQNTNFSYTNGQQIRLVIGSGAGQHYLNHITLGGNRPHACSHKIGHCLEVSLGTEDPLLGTGRARRGKGSCPFYFTERNAGKVIGMLCQVGRISEGNISYVIQGAYIVSLYSTAIKQFSVESALFIGIGEYLSEFEKLINVYIGSGYPVKAFFPCKLPIFRLLFYFLPDYVVEPLLQKNGFQILTPSGDGIYTIRFIY